MLAGVKINARCSTVLFARLAMCVCVCVCVHEECVRMRTRYETVVNKVEFLLSWKCIFWNFPRRILFIYLFIYLENIYFQIFQEYCDTILFIYLFIYIHCLRMQIKSYITDDNFLFVLPFQQLVCRRKISFKRNVTLFRVFSRVRKRFICVSSDLTFKFLLNIEFYIQNSIVRT